MSQQHVIKVLTVDDHHLIREGIATVIGSQTDMELIAQASGGIEAIQLYRQHRPDITLMDDICSEFDRQYRLSACNPAPNCKNRFYLVLGARYPDSQRTCEITIRISYGFPSMKKSLPQHFLLALLVGKQSRSWFAPLI
jgi:DNA-binding NarL/FixJ family response regulator